MKKNIFTFILFGLSVAVGVVLAEGILTVYYSFTHGTLSRAALIAQRETILPTTVGPVLRPGTDQWVNQLVVHPFFGYVQNPELPGVNNFGFLSQHDIVLTDSGYSLEGGRREDLLMVGLFGGSFVERMNAETYYLEAKLKAAFPDKTPVVLNFGIGGHALPQAAFIFIYFQELFDVAIFLDGLNEIWNIVDNNNAGVPPEYAKAAHFQYKLSLSELTPERFQLTSQIMALRQRIVWLTQLSLLPLIRHSVSIDLVWQALTRQWEYQIAAKSLQIRNSYEQPTQFFALDNETLINAAVRQWLKYHRLVQTLAASQGIVTLHLLQPNPCVKDAKIFTEEEHHRITHSFPICQHVSIGYPKLQAAVSQLQHANIIAQDLSMIYQPVRETIWIDAAHPNQKGNQIV